MMAGKWWIFVAVLLVLGATAKNVNLVIPQRMMRQPLEVDVVLNGANSKKEGAWKVFDRLVWTKWTVSTNGNEVTLIYRFDRPMLVKKYKIRLPPRAGKKVIPRAWSVSGFGWQTNDLRSSYRAQFGEVSDAVYVKREFKGTIQNPTAIHQYRFTFKQDGAPDDGKLKISLGDISLIGPKSQLDQPGFPNNGLYPCPAAMELIRTPSAASNYFGYARLSEYGYPKTPMNEFVRLLFDIDDRNWWPNHSNIGVYPFGDEDVIFGCIFDTPTEALMFSFMESASWGTWGYKLQGSFCQPDCDEFGSSGWVDLSVQDPVILDQWQIDRPHLFPIEQPDSYKAYRIVATPSQTNSINNIEQEIQDINLYKCRG